MSTDVLETQASPDIGIESLISSDETPSAGAISGGQRVLGIIKVLGPMLFGVVAWVFDPGWRHFPRMFKWLLKREPPDFVTDNRPPVSRPFRTLMYRVYVVLGMYHVKSIPPPKAGSYRQLTMENDDWMWSVRHLVSGVIVLFGIAGGIMKSTGSTWLGARFKRIFKFEVIVLDFDPGSHRVARRFGLGDHDSVTINWLAALLKKGWRPKSAADFLRRLATDIKTGVRFISASPMDQHRPIPEASGVDIVELAGGHAQIVVVDNMPGQGHSLSQAALMMADARNLCCHYRHDETLDDIVSALDWPYWSLRHEQIAPTLLVRVGNVPRHLFTTREQYRLAAEWGMRPEQVVLFPKDQYQFEQGLVDSDKVNKRTEWAESEYQRRNSEILVARKLANPQEPLPETSLYERHEPTMTNVGMSPKWPMPVEGEPVVAHATGC